MPDTADCHPSFSALDGYAFEIVHCAKTFSSFIARQQVRYGERKTIEDCGRFVENFANSGLYGKCPFVLVPARRERAILRFAVEENVPS